MHEQQGSEEPIAPAPQSSIKRRSPRARRISMLLLIPLILGSGYFAWFGTIGSGLPIALGSRYHLDRGIADELLVGPDHNIWFNYTLLPGRGLDAQLGSFTPDGLRTSMHLTYPGSFNSYYDVKNLSVGADGTIWGLGTLLNTSTSLIDGGSDIIWRIDARTGAVTFYPKSLPLSNRIGSELPNSIVAGHDGYAWYTGDVDVLKDDNPAPAVSRLDPRNGSVKRYFPKLKAPTGTIPSFPDIGRIAQGPDGDLWFTMKYQSQIVSNHVVVLGRLHPQTGAFTSITLPNVPNILTYDVGNPISAGENSPSILPTPDGGVWVLRTLLSSSSSGGFFTRLNYVSPSGQVKVISAPDNGLIEGFAFAPDHTLWTVYNAPYHWPLSPLITQENRLARVSPDGTFTTLRRLPAGDVTDIAIGQNSQLWIAIEDHPGMDIEGIMLPA